jgi:lipoprotein-anchoring transpeptidase ErfK/SrfK
MKSLPVPALAVVCFVTFLTAPVRAESFSNCDSKHRSMAQRAVVERIDYDKYLWLSPTENQPPDSVNRIVVSLADQRLYAYHNRQLIAWSNISSGRPGHETPTGTFTVTQKDVDHHSSLYDDASMPFFMRLTDTAVGLHAGFLPGYPASHGCVRLPFGMARQLYGCVETGTPVEIVSEPVKPAPTQTATSAIGSLAKN